MELQAASLKEIKNELETLDADALQQICLRLAKYKKENKELLTYLLFEATDEHAYVEHVKAALEDMFHELPIGNVYYIKKNLRKILRFANRQIKYSSVKQTELEIRIYFCLRVKQARVPLQSNTVLGNLYQQQVKKVTSVLAALPEDIQGDYEKELRVILA